MFPDERHDGCAVVHVGLLDDEFGSAHRAPGGGLRRFVVGLRVEVTAEIRALLARARSRPLNALDLSFSDPSPCARNASASPRQRPQVLAVLAEARCQQKIRLRNRVTPRDPSRRHTLSDVDVLKVSESFLHTTSRLSLRVLLIFHHIANSDTHRSRGTCRLFGLHLRGAAKGFYRVITLAAQATNSFHVPLALAGTPGDHGTLLYRTGKTPIGIDGFNVGSLLSD